jgi:hypothetical protein
MIFRLVGFFFFFFGSKEGVRRIKPIYVLSFYDFISCLEGREILFTVLCLVRCVLALIVLVKSRLSNAVR